MTNSSVTCPRSYNTSLYFIMYFFSEQFAHFLDATIHSGGKQVNIESGEQHLILEVKRGPPSPDL